MLFPSCARQVGTNRWNARRHQIELASMLRSASRHGKSLLIERLKPSMIHSARMRVLSFIHDRAYDNTPVTVVCDVVDSSDDEFQAHLNKHHDGLTKILTSTEKAANASSVCDLDVKVA